MLQFVLDFFADAPVDSADAVVTAAPAPAVPRRPNSVPNRHLAQQTPGQAATENVAFDIPALALSRHPDASRVVHLGGHAIGYAFERGRRRTIGFSVGMQGLSVRAPQRTPQAEIDAALREKAGWIVRKLGEMAQRAEQVQASRIDWQGDALWLDHRGRPLQVLRHIDPLARRASTVLEAPPAVAADGDASAIADADADAPTAPRLRVRLPTSASNSATAVRDAVQAWMARDARALFTERLDHFAPLLGVQWRSLHLSNAATRWGSASADGSIRLHWRLVQFRLPVIDYVVAHELAHLRHMDHSPRFWSVVASVVPDYAALRRELKGVPIARWD